MKRQRLEDDNQTSPVQDPTSSSESESELPPPSSSSSSSFGKKEQAKKRPGKIKLSAVAVEPIKNQQQEPTQDSDASSAEHAAQLDGLGSVKLGDGPRLKKSRLDNSSSTDTSYKSMSPTLDALPKDPSDDFHTLASNASAFVASSGLLVMPEELEAIESQQMAIKVQQEVLGGSSSTAGVFDESDHQSVDDHLLQLDDAISNVRKKTAYEKILFLNPGYVEDRRFKLIFLRADRFDPAKAARRMVDHCERKLELFGLDALARDVTWEDLKAEDKAAYQTRSMFLSANIVDTSGRPVLIVMENADTKQTNEWNDAQLRSAWYIIMRCIQSNEAAQKLGLVSVIWAPQNESTANSSFLSQIKSNLQYIPARFNSFHTYIGPRASAESSLLAVSEWLDLETRLRIRNHCGSYNDCISSLATFGMPVSSMPIVPPDADGKLDTKKFDETHAAYMEEEQRQIAAQQRRRQNDGVIDCPCSSDIILGRGNPYQSFPGNLLLAEIIRDEKDRHTRAPDRIAKTAITVAIMTAIKAVGGRFLKRTAQGSWVEVDDEVAREKVAMDSAACIQQKGVTMTVTGGALLADER